MRIVFSMVNQETPPFRLRSEQAHEMAMFWLNCFIFKEEMQGGGNYACEFVRVFVAEAYNIGSRREGPLYLIIVLMFLPCRQSFVFYETS